MNWMELLGLSGFEDFEKVELNELKVLEQKHRGHVLKAGRRFVAAMLAAAMILPSAAMAAQPTYPPQANRAADGTSVDDPHIEIESNFVHDEFGFLTNTLELAIRVQSPMQDTGNVDENGDPILVPKTSVQAVSVNLAYNTEILHPVSWEWARDERQAASYDVITNVTHYYDTKLETQKDRRNQTAAATTGIVDTTVHTDYTVTDNIADGKQGLLYFTARAFKPEPFAEMTTIAVIRFAVEDSVMEHIEIKKKSGDDYTIRYDGIELKDVVDLQDAMAATLPLVEFAQQADIEDADGKAVSEGSTLLYYSDDFTQMNHIPDFDPEDANMVESVKRPINGADYTLDRPNTPQTPTKPTNWNAETLTLACDEAAGTYSYTTNLIHKDNIKFTVVSKKSFMAPEDILGNLTTIVYVDWDNTIIGTQIVPKRTDLRGLVSDYVAENFIYHDDDASTYNGRFDLNDPAQIAEALTSGGTPTAAEDIVSSLERKYNYRGKYPATGPMGLDSDGNTLHDSPDTVVNAMDGTRINGMPTGSEYPLTNKLDYVFFKRPMTHTDQSEKPDKTDSKYDVASDPDGSKYEADYNAWYFAKTEWSQKTVVDSNGDPTSDPYWDVEHPYAYGWALCTVDNYKDMWTTLGMGELGSTAKSTEAASLAFQTNTSMGYSGASAGGYQDLSTGANTIASVTYDGDAAFAFADLEKGFTESMVFLKAVYEPGKYLYDYDAYYRMVEAPYYNKLNGNAANNGGAYSADMAFERSDARRSGDVHGVARMRDVIIRQDSTTDLYWETKDLNSGLENASQFQADSSKRKTAYVPVTVDNGDIVKFSLTLSARFNKIDYYLVERYGSNFVAGGQRSAGNVDKYPQKDDLGKYDYSEYVLDNYNYYAEDSERKVVDSIMDDEYFDVTRFEEREGSHGFVLESTLNNLVGYSSRYVDDPTDSDFGVFVTIGSVLDANLRKNNGEKPDETTEEGIMQMELIAVAQEAAKHRGDPDYWNVEKDWAELTYHQVQHYITSNVLYSRAAADAIPIQWCNLHVDCANKRSGKPTDWEGIITAARKAAQDNDPNRPIGTLDAFTSADELEKMVYIRQSGGVKYPDRDSLGQAIVDAVKALDNGSTTVTTIYSWNQIQTQILGDSAADGCKYAKDNYWWYDGADSVSFDTLADTVAAAMETIAPTKKAPGETTAVSRGAKLNQLESVWQGNDSAAATTVTTAWRNATKNLCATTTVDGKIVPNKFTSFNAFTSAFTAAVTAANTAGDSAPALPPDNATPAELQQYEADLKAYWQKLQYHIIHSSYPTAADQSEMDGYYWYDGAVQVNDLESMLKAARDYLNNVNTASWNNFTNVDDLYADANKGSNNAPGLGFRQKFDGTKYGDDSSDADNSFDKFKEIVENFVRLRGLRNEATATSTDWDMLQYYIINDEYEEDNTTRNRQARYYWWKNGGSPAAVDFTTFQSESDRAKRAGALAEAIGDAVFRAEYNGNTVAWDELDADAATILESGRLVKAWAGTEATFPGGFDDNGGLFTAADMKDLKDAAKDLLVHKNGGVDAATFPVPTFTWEELQFYLLNGTFMTDGDNETVEGYWWKSTDTKPSDKDPRDVEFARLVGYIAALAEAIKAEAAPSDIEAAEEALQKFFDEEMAQYLGFVGADPSTPVIQDELDVIGWTVSEDDGGMIFFGFNENIWDGGCCWGEDPDNGDYPGSGDFTFTWYQLQNIILNGALTSAEISADNVVNGMGVVPPTWVAEWDGDAEEYVETGKGTVVVPLTASLFLAPRPMMLANKAPLSKEERIQALIDELEELTGKKVVLEEQPAAEPKPITPEADKGKDENKNTDTYIIAPDTDIKNIEDSALKAEDNDGSGSQNAAASDDDSNSQNKGTAGDDSDSQSAADPTSQSVTTPKDTQTTVPAKEEAETEVPMQTLPQEPDNIVASDPDPGTDDDRRQSASDPPVTPEDSLTAPPLESVTGLRLSGEGPTRFRASPQRSPWIRFSALELLPTLTNRRITA